MENTETIELYMYIAKAVTRPAYVYNVDSFFTKKIEAQG